MNTSCIITIVLLIISFPCLGTDYTVKPLSGGSKVLLNGKIENKVLEATSEESLQMSGNRPVITTKTFIPPKDKKFVELKNEKNYNSHSFVDVLDCADGFIAMKLIDTDSKVKISRFIPTTNAADFSLVVEGNLINKTSGSGGGKTTKAEYWTVQVLKDKKAIALQDVTSYVVIGGEIQATAVALSGLTPQEGICITLQLEDDIGDGYLSDGDPFYEDATKPGPIPGDTAYDVTIQNRQAPKPHDKATKYKLIASSKGYEPAIAYITIVDGRWFENSQHKYEGYDPIADSTDKLNRPQLIVGKNKTSNASELITKINKTDNILINTISPAATIAPPQSNETKIPTAIVGKVIGSTEAIAKKGDGVCARMKVFVKDEIKKYKLKFIYVKDTPTKDQEQHTGSLTDEEKTIMFEGARDIWYNQTLYLIDESPAPTETLKIPKMMKDIVTETEASEIITKYHTRPLSNEIYVYVFWHTKIFSDTLGGGFVDGRQSREIIIDQGATAHLLAHEIGHVLLIPGDYAAIGEAVDDLMAYGEGSRIHKAQADLINP